MGEDVVSNFHIGPDRCRVNVLVSSGIDFNLKLDVAGDELYVYT